MLIRKSFNESNTFKEKILNLNFSLIFIVLIIGIISCFAMYSTDGGQFAYHTKSHIYRFSIFFSLFIILSFVNLEFWHKYAYIIYILSITLLILVEFFGLTSSGSKRWLNLIFLNLQPSELVKIGIILFLARFYNRIPYAEVNKIKYLFVPIAAVIIPMFFIIRQPDLGTAILIFLAGIVMVWLGGVKVKYFLYSTITFVVTAPFIIIFLKPYQKLRILTFLNPERDPLGAGYQIIQSKIAIGSGGAFGQGYLQGSQNYLDYLPEKHTDFIFTLYSEEFGFVGSIFLLILYLLLTVLITKVGSQSKSSFSKFYCYGFSSILFIYTFVNMFMVLGLLPTVGSPLPIMSYGGSSMMAIMVGFGVVMSCHMNRNRDIN